MSGRAPGLQGMCTPVSTACRVASCAHRRLQHVDIMSGTCAAVLTPPVSHDRNPSWPGTYPMAMKLNAKLQLAPRAEMIQELSMSFIWHTSTMKAPKIRTIAHW